MDVTKIATMEDWLLLEVIKGRKTMKSKNWMTIVQQLS